MKIERIPETALSPTVEAEIADLLGRCFDTDFGGRSYYQQRHHLRLTARVDGALVGHVALCLRDVRLGDSLVSIAGLAEVATDPAARGQGIAGALLDAAIAEVRNWPVRFFALFGDRPLYAARGFRPQPNTITYLVLDGARTGPLRTGADGGLMVLPIGPHDWDGTQPLDLLGHKF